MAGEGGKDGGGKTDWKTQRKEGVGEKRGLGKDTGDPGTWGRQGSDLKVRQR